jgi:UrcA family protein
MIRHRTNTTATLTSGLALLTSGLLASFCAPAPASADTEGEVLTQIVRYDDLNLATRRGAEALYHRLTDAAYKVCWPLDHGNIRGREELEACLKNAVSNAVAKLNIPAVTAIHERIHSRSALAAAPIHHE